MKKVRCKILPECREKDDRHCQHAGDKTTDPISMQGIDRGSIKQQNRSCQGESCNILFQIERENKTSFVRMKRVYFRSCQGEGDKIANLKKINGIRWQPSQNEESMQ